MVTVEAIDFIVVFQVPFIQYLCDSALLSDLCVLAGGSESMDSCSQDFDELEFGCELSGQSSDDAAALSYDDDQLVSSTPPCVCRCRCV